MLFEQIDGGHAALKLTASVAAFARTLETCAPRFAADGRGPYCAPLSDDAQKASGYRNWISANKLALTLISAVVAREYGSTKISRPTHEQISISLHFPKPGG
jgi:hypothetical protein